LICGLVTAQKFTPGRKSFAKGWLPGTEIPAAAIENFSSQPFDIWHDPKRQSIAAGLNSAEIIIDF
jgi:hypothetical protein